MMETGADHSPLVRPKSHTGDLRRLPAALAPLVEDRRWVLWRWELDQQRRKWTKVPYQPNRPHLKAKSNDPATWSSHAMAIAVVERGDADGIGYQLAGGEIAAFDLDDCRDPKTGEIAPWAWSQLDEAQSYAEVTVSGTGLRIIGRAQGTHVHRKFAVGDGVGSLEIYRQAKRFIVVTGTPVEGAYDHLADIDRMIDAAVERYETAKAPSAEKPDILDFNGATSSSTSACDERGLPIELRELISSEAPLGARSQRFHHAVGWLKDYGWTSGQILSLLERHPNGVAAKYSGRLGAEVARCFSKTGGQAAAGSERDGAQAPSGPQPLPLHWHGDPDDTAERKMLVVDTIPETGKGLLAGQWGTGKTFVALDLAGSVMTGAPFAGRSVSRIGGVLFIAAEGANEVSIRLRGVVDAKLKEQPSIDPARLRRLPFAWLDECPALTRAHAASILKATIAKAAERMQAEFDLPLVLIVVDTLMSAADFEDENDAAQGQKVMRLLEELGRSSGAFVLAVDHFGKAVETGTRGTSAKEGAADVVLALLGEKDMAGNVTNRRMAVRKLRGGATGAETPFQLSIVTIEPEKAFAPNTTCVVVWNGIVCSAKTQPEKDRWPRSLKILKAALLTTIIEHGRSEHPFGSEGPLIKTTTVLAVRAEFLKAYPATGSDDPTKQAEAKRRAFDRAVREAVARQLAVTRELRGVDHIWLAADEPTIGTSTTDRQDTS